MRRAIIGLLLLGACGGEPPQAPPPSAVRPAPPPVLADLAQPESGPPGEPTPAEQVPPSGEPPPALAAQPAPAPPPPGPDPSSEARARALALNEEAVALFQQGQEELALDRLRQALRLAPDVPTLRHNAARCLITRGDRLARERRFEEAARDYHEAASIDPQDPLPALREAQALQEALRDRDVVALLMDAVRRWPEQARAHELLARSLYRLGENRRAIEAWEEALRLDPAQEGVRAALERVRREEAVEKDLLTDLGAPHFTIKYDGGSDVALGRLVGSILEQAYLGVGQLLGRYPTSEVAVVIYPGRSFQETTGAHAWVAALYDGKIRVPAAGLQEAPRPEVQRVLVHEYAHALLRAVGGPQVPVWLQEGFAQVAEGRSSADARRLLRADAAPTLAQLEGSFASEADPARVRVLYAGACDLVQWLLGQGGGPRLADALDALARGQSTDAALRAAYGRSAQELHAEWQATLPR
mgnify:CR=1 FL=1